jgi:hypothetical protein
MHTYATALALSGITVPDHLTADAEVPVLTGPQAQGDLLIVQLADSPGSPARPATEPVPAAGVQVIHGEATGNTHWLHAGFDSPGVRWSRAEEQGVRVGVLTVPRGQSALLIHTDEHGANGIGPGTYAIHRKRAAEVTVGQVVAHPEPVRDYLIVD